jgi:hypothetical protein
VLPRIAAVAGLSAVAALATVPAVSAQTACLAHDKLVDMLDGRYSERPVAAGLDVGGRLFEVFAAKDGATWTMVVTTPQGASCVVAVGEEWQEPKELAFDPET